MLMIFLHKIIIKYSASKRKQSLGKKVLFLSSAKETKRLSDCFIIDAYMGMFSFIR